MAARMIDIHDLDGETLAAVADLHCAAVPSLLADLGPAWARRFHTHVAQCPDALGFVVREDGAVAGFVVGGPRPGRLLAPLRKRPFALGWTLLRKPAALRQAFASFFRSADALSGEPGAIELMYIAVAPDCRGRGHGAALVQRFLDAAAERGARTVTLSVETDNEPAIALYRRHDFHEFDRVREGNFERLRMARTL